MTQKIPIKLCNTIISIDPRGDHSIKFNALYYIKKSLENNSITKWLNTIK